MKKLRTLFHPIAIFVLAQISWGLLMFVWIRWYVLQGEEVENLMKAMGPTYLSNSVSTVILVQGCVLMGLILIGMYLMFLAFRRQSTLNRLQRNILDSVTHELKTPLASLRLHTETILMRPLSEESRNRFLTKSVQEIERLERLIEEILLSARLDSGISESEKSSIELLPILEECYSRTRERVGNKRIFSCYVNLGEPHSPFRMQGNTQQLEMLFNNLLDNAVKYTDESGSISIEVTASQEHFKVIFSDNGCGIDKNDINKIFDKFFRSNTNQKRRATGSGLGLFVCRTIVRNHGGRITVTSPGLNKGASFHVEFQRTSRAR
jgi:signal transduction histidine kinase